jgi:hypothetical protein
MLPSKHETLWRWRGFTQISDDGCRELIIERAKETNVRVIVEIGVFTGGSVLRWLNDLPDVIVIGIDPWNWKCVDFFNENKEFYRKTTDLKGMTDDECVDLTHYI